MMQNAQPDREPCGPDAAPFYSPVKSFWRRVYFFSVVAFASLLICLWLADLFWGMNFQKAHYPMLLVFMVLSTLLVLGSLHAVFGFFARATPERSCRVRITRLADHASESLKRRHVVVIPVYNEDSTKVCARLEAIYRSIETTGQLEAFDFFLLSDTRNADLWVLEEVSWANLCRKLNAFGRIYYRRRIKNENRKAGNIGDFVRTWGGRYESMLVLDADSLMAGPDIVTMTRVMEAHPGLGILQTPPRLIRGNSVFTRLQQFAMGVYGPNFIRGLNFWQLGGGSYWGHNFVDLVFPVEVGSLGYNTYVIDEGSVDGFDPPVKTVEQPGPRQVSFAPGLPVLENEFLSVGFDSLTGGVNKLIDKRSGRNLADPANPLGVLEYALERPWGMSAWVIAPVQEREYPLAVQSLRNAAEGPFLAVVEAKLKVKGSDVTVTYRLKAGQPWLEIEVKARWVEIGTKEKGCPSLLMRFPMALSDAKGLYEIPFGAIERDLNNGEEVPALRWVDVSGKALAGKAPASAGCTVANDSKYGYSLEGSTLRTTLIRSSYEPDPIPEVGDHIVRFAVMPHAARPAKADLVRMGAAFNHPLQVVATDVHKGELNPAGEALTVGPDSVVLSSLKKAEGEEAFVIRLQETAGKAATAKVSVSAALLGEVRDVVEVDLLERPAAKSSASRTPDGFSVKVPAYGIASVKVVLGK